MDRRFPDARKRPVAAAIAMALALAGCKSVPEVPPGRKMGGTRPNLPVSTALSDNPGVGFGSTPGANGGPSFANGAPGSTTFRGSTAQTIPPNPFDLPPDGVPERAAGYQVPGLDPSPGSSGRPASMLGPGYR
ncbi:MAG: hypothetical protein U0800_18925 [Isosphaeraceae bacterium]